MTGDDFFTYMAERRVKQKERDSHFYNRCRRWLKQEKYHNGSERYKRFVDKRFAFNSFSYRKSYYLKHPQEMLEEIYHEIRSFWQRGVYGWAECDSWHLDTYLARWLPDALDCLNANSHTIANPFVYKAARQAGYTTEQLETDYDLPWRDDVHDLAIALQKEEYNTIARAFELYYNTKNGLADFAEAEKRIAEAKEGMYKLIDCFEEIWD